MTRVIYELQDGEFDTLLREVGEFDAEDQELITVHPSGACVIHRCKGGILSNTWRAALHDRCECGWKPSQTSVKKAEAITRCGK